MSEALHLMLLTSPKFSNGTKTVSYVYKNIGCGTSNTSKSQNYSQTINGL